MSIVSASGRSAARAPVRLRPVGSRGKSATGPATRVPGVGSLAGSDQADVRATARRRLSTPAARRRQLPSPDDWQPRRGLGCACDSAWALPVSAPTVPLVRPLTDQPDRPSVHRVRTRPCQTAVVITRRGRLVLTTVVAAIAAIAGIAGTVWLAGSGPSAAARVLTVERGQTLSQIARTAMPDVSTQEAVLRLELANDLTSSQIHAGQRLTVPTR